MPEELPPSFPAEASLVVKPDQALIDWFDDIEAFISTEAYSR